MPPVAAAPKGRAGFELSPEIVLEPGVAKDASPLLLPLRPPNALCPRPLPNREPAVVLGAVPPSADLEVLLPPKAPNPLGAGLGDFDGEAKLDSLGPAGAAAKGDLATEAPTMPNGEAEEAASLPNPEDLNLSSLVWGGSSGFVFLAVADSGFGDKLANGEATEEFAKPLPGGIYSHS